MSAAPATRPDAADVPSLAPTLAYVRWRRTVQGLDRVAIRLMVGVVGGATLLVGCALAVLFAGAATATPEARALIVDAALLGALVAASVLVFALCAVLPRTRQLVPPQEQAKWEHRLASEIQTSILPRQLDIEGIEIAACMVPCEYVGGDYYDVIPVPDGCWIGIGDVAGHGLDAGLVMFMVQGMVQALVRADPDTRPAQIVAEVNRTVYDFVRNRQRREEHVTFCLVHYRPDGHLIFAGGHEDIILRRKAGRAECIPVMGPWLGAVREVDKATVDTEAQLEPGDLMLLYTDGLIEARNAQGEFYGLERLCAWLEGTEDMASEKVRDGVMAASEAFTRKHDDDRSLVAVRCQGVYWS